MFRRFLKSYLSLPGIWWVLMAYTLVEKSLEIALVYRSVILSDFQNLSASEISVLLSLMFFTACLCNLLLGVAIDRSRDLIPWIIIPKLVIAGATVALAVRHSFPVLCLIVPALSFGIYTGSISLYKLLRLLNTDGRDKESMLVIFSTLRHLGLLFLTILAFFFFAKLQTNILIIFGIGIFFLTLMLWMVLHRFFSSHLAMSPQDRSKLTVAGSLNLVCTHWTFFAAIFLVGVLYEYTLMNVVPLLFKEHNIPRYVERFSLLEAASKGVFLLMPLLFFLIRRWNFGAKARLFLAGHVLVAFFFLGLQFRHGWWLTMPFYAGLALWGEAYLTLLMTKATMTFDRKIFAQVSGLFEFFVFLGIACSSALSSLFLEWPSILPTIYLLIPVVIYALTFRWNKHFETLAKQEAAPNLADEVAA